MYCVKLRNSSETSHHSSTYSKKSKFSNKSTSKKPSSKANTNSTICQDKNINRSVISKNNSKDVKQYKKPQILIVREEDKISTRLEQLSWVPVRKLLIARSQYEGEPEKYEWYNRLIRKGLFSIYTRLSRFQMPPPKEKPKPMTPGEIARHKRHINRLAKPARYNTSSSSSKKSAKKSSSATKSGKNTEKSRKQVERKTITKPKQQKNKPNVVDKSSTLPSPKTRKIDVKDRKEIVRPTKPTQPISQLPVSKNKKINKL